MAQSRLPSPASSDEELPLYNSGLWPSQSKHRRTSLFRVVALCPNTVFFGFAALTGVLLFVIFTLFSAWWSSGRGLGSPEFHSSSLAPELPTSPTSAPSPGAIISTESLLSPPSEIASNLIDYHHLEIEELRDLVGKAKGFYGRDYSLWLGWNNMRYIIDAAFLQAQLLNRTLILPSFVYARACEYDLDVCADYADMVNKGKAMNDAQWDDRPIEEQMGYRIPLPLMLNITRMRSVHPVILVSDYLRLHGLPGDIESGRGSWEREKYHTHANIFSSDSHRLPSLFVVKNGRYDSGGTVRVDALPQKMKERGNYEGSGVDGHWPEVKETAVSATLREALPRNGVLDWHTALDLLRRTEAKDSLDLEKEEQIEAALLDNGWEVLYTFDSIQGRDLTKTVVNPIRQVAPRSSIHGWKDDYGEVDADVLVLEGETHLWRKAGAMQFTTAAARKEFQRTVLYTLVRSDAFQDLGQVLASRMSERTGGRLWVGAHLRRGDFAELGWTFSTTLEDHVNRIKKEIDGGRQLLQEISNVELYEIPDVQPDNSIVTRGKPLKTDPFYVATDERSPEGIQYLRSQGAVLLSDLLNQEDRRALGWPLMLTDVRALVEQELLSHSAYFVGTSISSVSGGIINMRAVYGADRRTIHMD